jgi:broad specificity phosphatase PhoE
MSAASATTTTLILCRHGESEGNRERRFGGHSPTRLTAHGRAQARAAGARLARSGIDVIYSSDLVRAAETAELIAAQLGITVRATSALRERSVGELTGLTFEEAKASYPDAYAALLRTEAGACPPGGETYAQCRGRAAELLDRVLAEHAGARILLVSHSITIAQLIQHMLGIEGTRTSFRVDHCALHTFEHSERGTRVVALNERLDVAAR